MDDSATRAVGYARVSTDDQAESGLGLAAQRATIEAAAAMKGWTLVGIEEDAASGKTTKRRPGLARALDLVASPGANVLIVSKLDRLSRSLPDFAKLLEKADAEGWSLAALDLGVDTSTSTGKMIANMVMNVAQWERERIGERTRDALAEVRKSGKRLGRPALEVSPEAKDALWKLRVGGLGWRDAANRLNGLAPRADGKPWSVATLRRSWESRPCPVCAEVGEPRLLPIEHPATLEQWHRMLAKQGGCAICNAPVPPSSFEPSFEQDNAPVFRSDHDHFTGRVRGMLCNSCNVRLARLGDTVEGATARLAFDEDPFVHEALHYMMGLPNMGTVEPWERWGQ